MRTVKKEKRSSISQCVKREKERQRDRQSEVWQVLVFAVLMLTKILSYVGCGTKRKKRERERERGREEEKKEGI